MVPGGLEVMSYTTRLTRGTRLQMRADTSRSSAFVNSYLQGDAYNLQSALATEGQYSQLQYTFSYVEFVQLLTAAVTMHQRLQALRSGSEQPCG